MANEFTKLMIDAGRGSVVKYSTGEASEAIRKQFFQVLGVTEDATPKEMRRAMRAHKAEVFTIIEDVIDELLISGWGDNPFFR